MTNPLPSTYLPLNLYLREENAALKQISDDLADAQQDLAKRLDRLAQRNGVGTVVRQAQLSSIHREIRVVQAELWALLGDHLREAGEGVASAAAEAVDAMDRALFGAAGQRMPEGLSRAHTAYAQQVVETYFSRMQNGISLSQQVYKTQALSQGWVDRAVNRQILQGASWRDLQKAVLPYVNPNTPGGVSYAAKRLARTELNNAFHTTQVRLGQGNPWVTGQQWNLSRSHPKADVCDPYAKESHYREEGGSAGPPGVYRDSDVPSKPHPQCYCFLTQVTVPEDEFLDRLLAGDYEDAHERFLPSPPSAALPKGG